MPSYPAPYRGMSGGALPPGYMEAASAPGRNIGAGLANIGKELGSALEEIANAHKQEAQLGKSAQAFADALGEKFPMDPLAFKNLSAKDKASVVQGIVQGNAYEKGKQDVLNAIASTKAVNAQSEYQQALTERLLNQEGERMDNRGRMANLSRMLQDRLVMPEGQQGPVAPLDGQEILGMLGKSGLLMDPNADNLITAAAKLQPPAKSGTATGTVIDLPGTGSKGVYTSPNSLQVVGHAAGELKPIQHPETKNLLGFMAPNGTVHFLPQQQSSTRDILAYEKQITDLEDKISQEQVLIDKKSPYANPEKLTGLRKRLDRVMSEYDSSFPDKSAGKPAAAKQGDGKPSDGGGATAPAAGAVRGVWKNGKINLVK